MCTHGRRQVQLDWTVSRSGTGASSSDNSASSGQRNCRPRFKHSIPTRPPTQVALLDRTTCAGVPYFLTPYFFTNALQLPVTSVIPGVTYRLLASSNLSSWSSLFNVTPPANNALLVDPSATNYPYRFYRLVTP